MPFEIFVNGSKIVITCSQHYKLQCNSKVILILAQEVLMIEKSAKLSAEDS